METDPGLLDRFTQNYIDTQKAIYENAGGERGLSDEAFIERYNESFELAEAEKETQIITWEVTHGARSGRRQRPPAESQGGHARFRRGFAKRDWGFRRGVLAHMWEICGPRYDAP